MVGEVPTRGEGELPFRGDADVAIQSEGLYHLVGGDVHESGVGEVGRMAQVVAQRQRPGSGPVHVCIGVAEDVVELALSDELGSSGSFGDVILKIGF